MNANEMKRGFNSGYTLRTHAPTLAEKFAEALTDREDPYAEGFIAGMKQREKEILINREKNYDHRNISTAPKQRDKNKDRDKGDRDR